MMNSAQGGETLTIDKLRKMQRLLEDIPPIPLLAYSSLFQTGASLLFYKGKKAYIGVSREDFDRFKSELPEAAPSVLSSYSLSTGCGCFDIDREENRGVKIEFFAAMAEVMAGANG